MPNKTLIGIVAVIVVCVGLLAWMNHALNSPNTGKNQPSGHKPPPMRLKDDIPQVTANWDTLIANATGGPLGNPNAPFTVIEFGDFQCPQCGKSHEFVDRMVQNSNGQVKLYFFNMPLEKIHLFAKSAALAGMAAAKQGKFWAMYDSMYTNQDQLSDNGIATQASTLGIDMTKFRADWNSPAANAQLSKDLALDKSMDIEVTPTFMLRFPNHGRVFRFIGLYGQQENPVYPGLAYLIQHDPWNVTYQGEDVPSQDGS